MPEGIIDAAELIQIDDEQRARLPGCQPFTERPGKPLPVGQFGQLIDVGQGFDARFGRLALTEIGDEYRPVDDPALARPPGGTVDLRANGAGSGLTATVRTRLVGELERLLGRKVDIVTEDGLYWLLRRRILQEARPL